MRFAPIISVVAIAALSSAPSALAKGNKKTDVSTRVDTGLQQIELAIGDLGKAFEGFTKTGKPEDSLTAAAVKAGMMLSTQLNDTLDALKEHNGFIKKSKADEIAAIYASVAGNLTVVATAVRKFRPELVKSGQDKIATQTLPDYETKFELLGKGLAKKIHNEDLKSIKKSWKMIDNQLECTLRTYQLKDASPDKNMIVRRKMGRKDPCAELDA